MLLYMLQRRCWDQILNLHIELKKICSLNFHLRTHTENSNSNVAWNWMILWPDSYHFLLRFTQENGGLDQARTVASIPYPHCFYGVKYGCKVECNLMQECNLSVMAWHLACCGPAVRVPTLPFMLLPVPSWQHVLIRWYPARNPYAQVEACQSVSRLDGCWYG